MRGRVLRACLRAFPRDVRARDGAELYALARDLAADHGLAREALGLLRGGWAERRRRATGRRRVAAVALTAATVPLVAVLTWSAAAAGAGPSEEERFECAADCDSVELEVARRVDGGWTCVELRATGPAAWRCTGD